MVERWHFGMLNDAQRNAKYKAAISKAIKQKNQVKVLDIGTGTGLLALYAHEAGAERTFACEESQIMCHIASETFRRNGYADQISLIAKHSNEINAGVDLGGEVDLIVTETMDCGVFGEGLIDTLMHAKERLLKSNGQIIPYRVKLFIAGFQSRQMAMEQNIVNSSCFTDTIYLRNYTISTQHGEPYDSCQVKHFKDFRLVTKVEEALNINLNNLDELRQLFSGKLRKEIRLAYLVQDAVLDGFCVWFELSLDADETIKINTSPFSQSESVCEQPTCWETAIFRLKHRFTNSQKLRNLNVTVSASNGKLELDHYYDAYNQSYAGLTTEMAKYLNDTELINALEYEIFAELNKRFTKPTTTTPNPTPTTAMSTTTTTKSDQEKVAYLENVLDFQPCPTVGIALLKERRIKTLFCHKDAHEFVKFIAVANCIPMDSFIFLNDAHHILFYEEKFDLIILPMIDSMGMLNSAHVANYQILKANKLTANGFMVPERIEVMCNIINSGWLRSVTRVTDTEIVDHFQIGPLINDYATTLHLELYDSFSCKNLYEAYRLADIELNDKYFEIEHKLYLGDDKSMAGNNQSSNNNAIHGILFYFNLMLTASSRTTISTKRPNSFARLGCFVVNENQIHKDGGFVTLRYRQNTGVIKIDLK